MSGRLVAEGDAEALAEELLKGVEEPELLSQFAANGARAVAEKFEQATQTRRHEDCYLEAMVR
ncbi:MAG: hypothetical protein H0U88_04955 [Chthoniobacterales bacterium]|nr:hypothetical protein [Chthoniobacterales bacterium]